MATIMAACTTTTMATISDGKSTVNTTTCYQMCEAGQEDTKTQHNLDEFWQPFEVDYKTTKIHINHGCILTALWGAQRKH